jgi:probable phosphoglycerate mutase
MRLVLVRHGETDWNRQGRTQGHIDIELNETGRRQAACAGALLSGQAFGEVWVSDLARARQTWEIVATQVTTQRVVVDPRLRERAFGEWEGRPYQSNMIEFAETGARAGTHAAHVRPPGGESLADVEARLRPLLDAWKEAKPIDRLVIGHGACLGVLLSALLGGPVTMARAFRFENGAATEIRRRSTGEFALETYNLVGQ